MLLEIFDPKAPPRAVGIDLGTTNSLVAYVRDGVPTPIADCHSETLVPSVVHYDPRGHVIVGKAAQSLAYEHPRETIVSVKRFMGRGGDDPETKKLGPYEFLPPAPTGPNTVRFGPTVSNNQLLVPDFAGRVIVRQTPDQVKGTVTRLVFYGKKNYAKNPAAYQQNVQINTPLTTDASGNVYFGFLVLGPTPIGLQSGLARVAPNGTGTWVSAASISGDAAVTNVAMSCAPALSHDGNTLYIATANANAGYGYLVAVNSTTLAVVNKVRMKDPSSGLDALIFDASSSSPTVGPDGVHGSGINPTTGIDCSALVVVGDLIGSQNAAANVAQPLSANGADLAHGEVGVQYPDRPLIFGGSGGPYSIVFSGAGTLPATAPGSEFSLDSLTGVLNGGVPNGTGTSTFSVHATDLVDPTQAAVDATFNIVVVEAVSVDAKVVPDGVKNVTTAVDLTASGGESPFRWHVASVSPGLQASVFGQTLSLRSATTGTFNVQVGVVDSLGGTAARLNATIAKINDKLH